MTKPLLSGMMFGMEWDSPAFALCIKGTQAEFQGRPEEAEALYAQAWQLARDDLEKCCAAHYVARFQKTPEDRLRWNLAALAYAETCRDARVNDWYPSLYLNLGDSYKQMGDPAQAQIYDDLAAQAGAAHAPDDWPGSDRMSGGRVIRDG